MADETPKVSANYSTMLEQAQLDYAAASKRGGQDQKDAALRLVLTSIQVGTLEEGSDLAREIQKVAPTLMKTLAETRVTLAKDGAQKTLELLKSRFEEQRKLLEKESKDLFDLAKSGSAPTISLMGTFKSFAIFLQGLGIDTSNFIKFCDDKIAEEQRKVPQINTKRLEDAGVKVSTISAELGVSQSVAAALQEVTDNAEKIADQVVKMGKNVGDRFTPSEVQPTPTQRSAEKGRAASSADIETTRVIKAIQEGIGIQTKVNLEALVKSSAASDKKSETLSAADWSVMENKLSMGIAMKEEAANEADAKAKAHQIIEQIREKARMGAPSLELR